MCNNVTAGSLNMSTGPSSKPGGGTTGTPVNTEHMIPPASQSTMPSAGGANPGAFNTPPASQK